MPLLSLLKGRDPVVNTSTASTAVAAAAAVFALLFVYNQQKRLQVPPGSIKQIPMPKEHYPVFGTIITYKSDQQTWI